MDNVKLVYFRLSGKYHTEGSYPSGKTFIFEIFDEVREMEQRRVLPGLCPNHGPFITLVDVPTHPANHPTLIMPSNQEGDE